MILLLLIMAILASLSMLCAIATLVVMSWWNPPDRKHARPMIVRPLRMILAEPDKKPHK